MPDVPDAVCGATWSSPTKFLRPLSHFECRTRAQARSPNGPGFFRQLERVLGRFLKCAAAARRKVRVIGPRAFCETFRCGNQFTVLQNMERRTIDCFRFFLAPLPQRAQHRRGPAAHQARARYSPRFIGVAHSLDRGLLQCALTRLPKPIQPIAFVQFFFQTFGQRQQIMRVVNRVFHHLR